MNDLYIFSEIHNGQFSAYSISHFCVLGLMALFLYKFFQLESWLKKNDKIFRYGSAVFLIIVELIYRYWMLDKIDSYVELIPLNFCDLTLLVTVYGLLTENKTAANLGLYWSIVGAVLAIGSPAMSYGPFHFRFFHYFLMHFMTMVCNLYFLVTGKISISNKNNIQSLVYANIITITIFILDLILDQNWFFLIESPIKPISDFFGFPLYSILWYIFSNLCMRLTYFALKKSVSPQIF